MHRRWWVWGTLLPAFLISYFHRVGLAAVGDALQAEFQTSAAALGFLSSLYFYIYAIMQVPVGMLADTWGPRRTVTAGLAVTAAGTLAFALAPGYATAAAGRLLVGLGVSPVFTCLLKAQAEWFPGRVFASLSGLVVFVGNMSGLLAYTPTAAVAGAFGWRPAFLALGLLTAAIMAAVWAVVRDRPADVGLPAPEGAARPAVPASLGRALETVAGNRRIWPAFIGGFGVYGAAIAFAGTWAVPYLREVYGLDRLQATSLAQLVLLGLALGAPAVGWASDRLRARRLPYIALSAGTVALTGWLAFGQPPRALIGPVLFLLGVGAAAFTLTWAVAKEVNPPEYAGLSVALANAGGFLGVALLQPLMGAVLDRAGPGLRGYQTALQLLFWACALAAAAAFRLTETGARNIAAARPESRGAAGPAAVPMRATPPAGNDAPRC